MREDYSFLMQILEFPVSTGVLPRTNPLFSIFLQFHKKGVSLQRQTN